MVYNWPHGTSVDIGPDLAERIAAVDNVVAIKDSTPDLEQFFETTKRVIGSVRVFGPFMSVAGLEFLLEHGGDGFIGGGSLWGAPDAGFWEAVWRGDVDFAYEHARRTDELFPKLWLPGGWGGQFGAYQSQLKALMRMLGQPGGDVRPPRLPVTDEASLQRMHEILVEAGLLLRAGGGGVSTFIGVDHVGIGVGDVDAAIEFYGRHVGFDRVLFDYTGDLPGLEAIAGRAPRARVAMAGEQRCDADRPGPGEARAGARRRRAAARARGTGVGRGRGVRDLPARAERAGGARRARRRRLRVADGADERRRAAYRRHPRHRLRRRSLGTKLEMIEWTGLWRSLPGAARAEGVNHVAFGVTDMARTRAFYERLGFTELLFESVEFFDPMAPWYEAPWYDPAALPAQHMTMPMPAQGAAIEPVVLDPPGHDCRGVWGHLGPMDFGIRVATSTPPWRSSQRGVSSSRRAADRSTSARVSGATSTSPSRTATTSRSSRRAIDRGRAARSRPGARPPCPRAPR